MFGCDSFTNVSKMHKVHPYQYPSARDVANREQLTATNNMLFVNQAVYFNIDLAQDMGLHDLYPDLRLRLETCTVTTYDDNDEAESFNIITDQCPTNYGLARIVHHDATEVEVLFHNYRDRRNPKSSINIKCSVCK